MFITSEVEDPNQGDSGSRALRDACRRGRLDAVRTCLDRNDDVNETNPGTGSTPLSLACAGGHVDVARLCLSRGAAVDRENMKGETPLHVSCWRGRNEAAALCIDHGAAPASPRGERLAPVAATPRPRRRKPEARAGRRDLFVRAAQHGLGCFRPAGADINRAIPGGATPLIISCCKTTRDAKARLELVRLLLDRGAEVDRPDECGYTALHIACTRDHVDAAALLLDFGADITRTTDDPATPLYTQPSGYSADGSRPRRGCHVDIPWRRVAATPRLSRGDSVATSRGDAAAATWTFGRDRRAPQVHGV